MRPATKHWMFFLVLLVTLAAMIAFVWWQISKARREPPVQPAAPAVQRSVPQ